MARNSGYTFLDLAEDVLKNADKPLLSSEIWEIGKSSEFIKKLKFDGKTPHATLGARLYIDVRDNPNSKIVKVTERPARFFLREKVKQLPNDLTKILEEEVLPDKEKKKLSYTERDLHQLVSYFAYTNAGFNRGRTVYTKTIFHEKSRKDGLNEWIHPDIVGFYLPINEWHETIFEFSKITENNALKLFSFEVKKYIDKSNYRESFFQAVSNSSWSNEGYLISANIKKDEELYSELERLSMSYGIGIIELDLEDIDSSKVIFQAKYKNNLDWETMNKLCELNKDFNRFIQDVKIDFESKRIHEAEYDSIPKDIEDVIEKLLVKK
ncbi:MAG: hypothetical protein IPL26_13685 [Leptospiraceae bacterium]|nr:hypothetical protein [Leptospiraceae bacterium]